MANRRIEAKEAESFPLQHMTEDTTDEFNHQAIAAQLQEMVRFYQVNKASVSQVFIEKH